MMDDILGSDAPRRAGRTKASRGDLHDVLTRALPDLRDNDDEVCNLRTLATKLGMSYQGVYKWFKPGRPNRLPPNQVDRIVEMSEKQTKRPKGFKPATREDFWPFLST